MTGIYPTFFKMSDQTFDIPDLPKEISKMVYQYYDFTPITKKIFIDWAKTSSMLDYKAIIDKVVTNSTPRFESFVEYITSNKEDIMNRLVQWLNQ